jgi:hypothetical protein
MLLAAGLVSVASPASAANLLGNPGLESGSLSPWACSLGSVVSAPVPTMQVDLRGGLARRGGEVDGELGVVGVGRPGRRAAGDT